MHRSCIAFVCCCMVLTAADAGSGRMPPLPHQPVNLPEDAGPAASGEAPPILPQQANRTGMMTISGRTHALGGGVRGFGLLGRYPAPGPGAIYVRRSTTQPRQEAYKPDCLLRVEDPIGRAVAVVEIPDSGDSLTVTCPAGPAGVYTISVIGGRYQDGFELELLRTPMWGIRGEMSLVVRPDTASTGWLWVPSGARILQLEQLGGQPGDIVLRDEAGNDLVATTVKPGQGKRLIARLDPAPAGTVVAVDLSRASGSAIVIDGVPGLLCPTQAAAVDLRGGTVEAGGISCPGPLQARIRAWMTKQRPEDLAVQFDMPATVPAGLAAPVAEAQLFGQYGGMSGLRGVLARQNLDPTSPWCGTELPPDAAASRVRWDSGVHAGLLAQFLPHTLAAVVATKARLNPLAGNRALARRAALAAFYHLSSLTGDRLIREGNTFAGSVSYPMTHAFFVFGALGSGLAEVEPWLDAEAKALWTEGVLAVSDKLGDHQGYQSNQWLHHLSGHLGVLEVTGEPRVRARFERQIKAFISGTYGADAKFGQHPAGYYLEEYGCDGNYDNMNLTAMVAILHRYRRMAVTDQVVVAAMNGSIERNLRFKSMLLMTDGGGAPTSPSSFNSRRPESSLATSNPAGDHLARGDSALAAAKVRLSVMPASGTYPASIFPYYVNQDAWALRLISDGLKGGLDTKSFDSGGLLPLFYQAYLSPMATPAELPFQAASGAWQLPGIVSWKRGGTYLAVFHDIAGTSPTRRLGNAVMGGGPTACWREGGMFIASQANGRKPMRATTPQDTTFSCVYGTNRRGTFVHSGQERSSATSTAPSGSITVTEQLSGGTVTWTYVLEDDGALAIAVALRGTGWREAFVNIPMPDQQAEWTIGPTEILRRHGMTSVAVNNDGEAWELSPALACANQQPVRCVRVRIVDNGPLVNLRFVPRP